MAEYDRLTIADDRAILRSLAEAVREIAADPANNEEKIHRWKAHTGLRGKRPMVFVFPDGSWPELLPYNSLQCSHPAVRNVEYEL